MAEIWLTHDVEDNLGYAVDFAVTELERAGVVLRIDGRNLRTDPLWQRAGASLLNPRKISAWCVYLSEATLSRADSLGQIVEAAAKVAEQRPGDLAIALVRPGSPGGRPIPPALASLPSIRMSEQYWAERLRAAVEKRRPEIPPPGIHPYALTLHQWGAEERQQQALEIRPIAGSWGPFVAGVPLREKDLVRPRLVHGPRGPVPADRPYQADDGTPSDDGQWWLLKGAAPADRLNSYYLRHDRMPETILFGVDGGHATYAVRLRPVLKSSAR
jgi:hypothetical protein